LNSRNAFSDPEIVRPRQPLEKLTKTVYPPRFTLRGSKVADARLNCQSKFFDSLLEIISLLEYEWVRPESSDLFRSARDALCHNAIKNSSFSWSLTDIFSYTAADLTFLLKLSLFLFISPDL
jgi:hypothetical protein